MKYYEVRIKEMIGRYTFVYVAADRKMNEEDFNHVFGCKDHVSGVHKVKRISFLAFHSKSKKYRHIKNPMNWARYEDCVVRLQNSLG